MKRDLRAIVPLPKKLEIFSLLISFGNKQSSLEYLLAIGTY